MGKIVNKRGRPKGSGSRYTLVLANAVCEEIADGKNLRQICRDRGIPWRTLYGWTAAHPDFAARLAGAREIGWLAIEAECQEIADTPVVGTVKTYKADGNIEAKEEDMLGHRKLQIETRLKLLAIWNPKKYGQKVEQTHKGDPTAPVALVLNGSDVHG